MLLLIIAAALIPLNFAAGVKYNNPLQEKMKTQHQMLSTEYPSNVEAKQNTHSVNSVPLSTAITAVQTVPKECLTATNLTQSWRLDHNGSHIRPDDPHSLLGYACDFYKELKWFRFSGNGGN